MTFNDFEICRPLQDGVASCGFTAPTPVQAEAIPAALGGRDLIASAQTGTGKTAGFMIPALQRLSTPIQGSKGAPRVLVLTPTRELAGQVMEASRSLGRFLKLRTGLILGGTPYREQFRALSRPLDLLVATPGRLIDHLDRGSLDLSHLEMLILDEADRMLDMGFIDDVSRVAALAPKDRQTLFFTATWNDALARLAGELLRDPERIAVSSRQKTADHIEQRLHAVDGLGHKHRMLTHIVNDTDVTRAIIFSATKRDADTLARELADKGHSAAALHGDMTQGARNRTVQRLRQGRIRLLVATDVAARGLDVTGISHVINFDLPKNAEDYVHRIGRTARAGASGIAISFVCSHDLTSFEKIQRYVGKKLPMQIIPGLEPQRPLTMSRPRPKRDQRGAPGRKFGRSERNSTGRTEKSGFRDSGKSGGKSAQENRRGGNGRPSSSGFSARPQRRS